MEPTQEFAVQFLKRIHTISLLLSTTLKAEAPQQQTNLSQETGKIIQYPSATAQTLDSRKKGGKSYESQ